MSKFELTPSDQSDSPRRGFLGRLLTGGAALAALPVLSSIASAQDGPGNGDRERDPAKLATAMIQKFDKDGDRALNRRELTEALTALMRHRGGQRDGQGQGGGRGGPGQGGGGKGNGQGAAQGAARRAGQGAERGNGQGAGRGAGQRDGKGRGRQGGGKPKNN